jgi:hypothetical protein
MSTRSRIGKQAHADAPVRSIYVHFDGYPEGVGQKLLESWNTDERIEALLDLGDLSSLGAELGEDRGTGYFDLRYTLPYDSPEGREIRERDECIAYRRDRGEENVNSKPHTKADWPDYGQEWEYLFDSTLGKWRCRTAGWPSQGYPAGKWLSIEKWIAKEKEAQEKYEAAQKS